MLIFFVAFKIPDSVLPLFLSGLTVDQVDSLWSCLITRIPDRFHFLLLSWLLKQTNNKELHALGLDNYKHIFMKKVGTCYLMFMLLWQNIYDC